jgi:hypothetical protein
MGKEIAVVPRFDTQNETQLVTLQFLNVGRIRTQSIFDDYQGQTGVVLA